MKSSPADGRRTDDDGEPAPLSDTWGTVRGRVRAIANRFVDLVARGVLSSECGGTASEGAESANGEREARLAVRVDHEQCPQIEGFPDRNRPLTYPGRDVSGSNSPDVVSIETNGGLRVSVPENPDATITSDVWTPVEP